MSKVPPRHALAKVKSNDNDGNANSGTTPEKPSFSPTRSWRNTIGRFPQPHGSDAPLFRDIDAPPVCGKLELLCSRWKQVRLTSES